jgi:hypothetical protein
VLAVDLYLIARKQKHDTERLQKLINAVQGDNQEKDEQKPDNQQL